ncbi:hypothetical protein LRS06_22215 [Hymenobacter sp. J193]|nr:hypothetical protein [Hymenobacter sp. J193]MCR5890446.1 hypothetical protein [Hymenobacter sp. J193]
MAPLPATVPPYKLGIHINWASVSAGRGHNVAVRTDGTLWTWGDGITTDQRYTPVQVGTATTWKSVAAGRLHSVAVRTDGTLWAWGDNRQGQLGDGTTTLRTVPVQVGTDTNWQSVAAGNNHTLAVRKDGTLWAWGNNERGQLGGGTTTEYRNSPVQVGTATTWKSVAAGNDYSVAVRTNGTLWAWGSNERGQLGDGTFTNRSVPVQVGTATTWAGVEAGYLHNVALRTDGTLWAWGNNADGQLGDGTSGTVSSAPIQAGQRYQLEECGGGQRIQRRCAQGRYTLGLGQQQLWPARPTLFQRRTAPHRRRRRFASFEPAHFLGPCHWPEGSPCATGQRSHPHVELHPDCPAGGRAPDPDRRHRPRAAASAGQRPGWPCHAGRARAGWSPRRPLHRAPGHRRPSRPGEGGEAVKATRHRSIWVGQLPKLR